MEEPSTEAPGVTKISVQAKDSGRQSEATIEKSNIMVDPFWIYFLALEI
jgi:hypothetical protein